MLAAGAPLPAALVLEGDAGIGKTTLWRAGIEIAGEAGHRVLRCQAAVAESQLAFAALSDLLAGALDYTLPSLPLPQRRALEIALLLVEPAGAPPDIRALAAACLGVIRQLTAHSTVVVAIDDVQWLDASSRTVLEFAVRRLTAEPVAVLVATRGIGQEPPLGLERTLPADRLLRVPVTSLSMGAAHRLLLLGRGAESVSTRGERGSGVDQETEPSGLDVGGHGPDAEGVGRQRHHAHDGPPVGLARGVMRAGRRRHA